MPSDAVGALAAAIRLDRTHSARVTGNTIDGVTGGAGGWFSEPMLSSGAGGWAGLERFFAAGEAPEDTLAVSLETAHPAKFPDEVRALTGVEPPLPPSLAAIEALPEHYERLDVDYPAFAALLAETYG